MEMTNMQMADNMPVVTQPANPEPQLPTLADVISGQPATQDQAQTQPSTPPAQEPGWFQGRLQKERAKWEADYQAQMADVQAQMSKLQEYYIGTEADKLVASGKISDRDIAMEYLRNKEGVPAPTTASTSPQRDERGRFVSPNNPALMREVPSDLQTRANELYAQAKTLQKVSGVDVIGVYRSNPAYVEKVNSGEWDMADVLMAVQSVPAQQMRAPTPVRSPNGIGLGEVSVRGMTDEQFARLNEVLAKGHTIDMR